MSRASVPAAENATILTHCCPAIGFDVACWKFEICIATHN